MVYGFRPKRFVHFQTQPWDETEGSGIERFSNISHMTWAMNRTFNAGFKLGDYIVNYRYDSYIGAQEFEADLLTNSLPTEQLSLLLVTIALAVGGLIYFCIHLVRIFPGIP